MINMNALMVTLEQAAGGLTAAMSEIHAAAERELAKRKDRTAQIAELDARILVLRRDVAIRGVLLEAASKSSDADSVESLARAGNYAESCHELSKLCELHSLLVAEDFRDSNWQYDESKFASWGRYWASSVGYFSGTAKSEPDASEQEPHSSTAK